MISYLYEKFEAPKTSVKGDSYRKLITIIFKDKDLDLNCFVLNMFLMTPVQSEVQSF